MMMLPLAFFLFALVSAEANELKDEDEVELEVTGHGDFIYRGGIPGVKPSINHDKTKEHPTSIVENFDAKVGDAGRQPAGSSEEIASESAPNKEIELQVTGAGVQSDVNDDQDKEHPASVMEIFEVNLCDPARQPAGSSEEIASESAPNKEIELQVTGAGVQSDVNDDKEKEHPASVMEIFEGNLCDPARQPAGSSEEISTELPNEFHHESKIELDVDGEDIDVHRTWGRGAIPLDEDGAIRFDEDEEEEWQVPQGDVDVDVDALNQESTRQADAIQQEQSTKEDKWYVFLRLAAMCGAVMALGGILFDGWRSAVDTTAPSQKKS